MPIVLRKLSTKYNILFSPHSHKPFCVLPIKLKIKTQGNKKRVCFTLKSILLLALGCTDLGTC